MAVAEVLRVAVICPWFYQGDAVGAAARETFLSLACDAGLSVTAFWTVNDYPDVTGHELSGVGELLRHPAFLTADILIYVFAVYHELFDALLVGNGRGRQVVRFHNVTPTALMPEKHWDVIERSFVQMGNFCRAEELWADSQENLEELHRRGQGGDRARVMPLAVPLPVRAALADKSGAVIRLLFVGRFFASKGVLELVEAVDRLRDLTDKPFKLRLVGNLRFSDPDYVTDVRDAIAARGLSDYVTLVGSVTPAELAIEYHEAHIWVTGSRHEGFCVPVIESLAAGCVPISYPVSNLRFIAGGLGVLAKDATPYALADTMSAVMDAVLAALKNPLEQLPLDIGPLTAAEFAAAADEYVASFTQEAFAARILGRVKALGTAEADTGQFARVTT